MRKENDYINHKFGGIFKYVNDVSTKKIKEIKLARIYNAITTVG